MAYPSTLSSITNPNAGDKLNSPSHSSIHSQENTAISEIQTFVGTLASTAGTLMYDIRSSSSDGGGHVQGVNKGGTGFTTYTKGDVLVAQSQSVLSKLGVGTDGQVLTADSSVAAGVKWGTNPATYSNNIAQSTSIQAFGSSIVTEVSILSVNIPGSTLGTSNAIRSNLYINRFITDSLATSVLLRANYGGTIHGSVMLIGTGGAPNRGKIEYFLQANTVSSQVGTLFVNLSRNKPDATNPSITGIIDFERGTSTVDSAANQILGMTIRYSSNNTANIFELGGYSIEKIA